MKTIILAIALAVLMGACTSIPGGIIYNETNGTNQSAGLNISGNSTSDNEADSPAGFFRSLPVSTPYKVTYQITTGNVPGTQTLAVSDGDMKIEVNTSSGVVSTYFLNNDTFVCTVSGNASCVQIGAMNRTGSILSGEEFRTNWEQYNATQAGTMIVAGQQARCFTANAENSNSEYCYSSEGVPLYVRSSAPGGSFQMVAQSYNTQLNDSEFTLPAQPVTLNASMNTP